jgi:quercetin dioxygenase-like cupin family protein
MEIKNFAECKMTPVTQFPFKGTKRDVKKTGIRWLSQTGDDGDGGPEYGLRHFTIEPGGEIPIHNHFYVQTMYILTGRFECMQYDYESESVAYTRTAGPGDFIYVPCMEAHGMKNISDEDGTFLCCIANVYDRTETD